MNATVAVTLKAVAYLALALFASPLLEGVMRKVKAVIHSRKGPPVTQPYLDLAKLLVKEDLSSESGFVARFAPPAAFAVRAGLRPSSCRSVSARPPARQATSSSSST